MSGGIILHRDGDVATIAISNPGKLNALDYGMWVDLATMLNALATDDSLRCLVLRGDGDIAFVSGGDVAEFLDNRMTIDAAWKYHEEGVAPAFEALTNFPAPVVASIQGPCIGGGLEIACCCDIRIASDNATFGAPINKLGFNMYAGELARVVAITGEALAADILLSGRFLNAQEALNAGLVSKLCPSENLALETNLLVRRITAGAPLAAREHKRWFKRLRSAMPISDEEKRDSLKLVDTEDYREALNAFLLKRKPEFKGR